ncbi:class I SAM-dependent methyltransferase [Salmonella enterica]|uniref:class I SAM-dependent methyltransferase n=1 Tax=Salmonella enterica TaxID=28901 RepID=UPI000FA1D67C|nr:class I SAM-dependent methyltransferase [Salmonella enterica subsp. enterica serovar Napoli]ECY4608523.1 class I SAM-dependent methyltransferase [Salmonella enterica subsp. enterica serovar Typhimurium]MLQ54288.1 class I SAM-dependent methyltransferase [Salmonella enterica subsp. enterica serovar Napoli]
MHSELRDRIQAMRARLDGRTPVAEIRASSQLFVSPVPVCRQMVDLAELDDSDRILEPEAGTGAILRAIREAAPLARCDAVELNAALAAHLRAAFPGVNVRCGDFLDYQPGSTYSKILMNPPFQHAQDIRHIQHALTLLESGGILTAVCLNGPRQQKILKPLSDVWEPLPRGTFTYTDVSTVLLRIQN